MERKSFRRTKLKQGQLMKEHVQDWNETKRNDTYLFQWWISPVNAFSCKLCKCHTGLVHRTLLSTRVSNMVQHVSTAGTTTDRKSTRALHEFHRQCRPSVFSRYGNQEEKKRASGRRSAVGQLVGVMQCSAVSDRTTGRPAINIPQQLLPSATS